MATIEEALRTLLLSDSTVSGLVGTRVYPMQLPLDCTLPAISYSKISSPNNHLIDVASPRFQFSCFAEDYLEVQQLKTAVVSALNRYKGVASGIHIKQIVFQDASDDYEETTGIFHVPVDFKIIYQQ